MYCGISDMMGDLMCSLYPIGGGAPEAGNAEKPVMTLAASHGHQSRPAMVIIPLLSVLCEHKYFPW